MPIMSLLARLGLDITGFQAGLAGAQRDAGKFAGGLKQQLAGAFTAAAVVQFTREIISQADAIDELSERLGITTKQAQEYSLAAKLGGGDSELFAKKFEVLREAMAKNPDALKGLGIQAETAQQAMELLADKIQNVGLSTDEAVVFVDLFGRNAGQFISILGDLRNAREGTIFFDDQQVQRLKKADDAFTKLFHNLKIGWGMAVDAAGKYFGDVIDYQFGIYGVPDPEKLNPPDLGDAEGVIARRQEAAKIWMATQDRVAKLEEQTFKLNEQAFDKQITNEQRIIQLYDEKFRIAKAIDELNEFKDPTGEAEAKLRNRLAEINLGIASAPREQFKIDSNPLGRMGAFIPSNSSTPSWAEKQIAIQDAIKKNGIELLRQIKGT